jgi:fatty-acyl-CoA synthase
MSDRSDGAPASLEKVSYVSGTSAVPLLDLTIGAALRRAAEKFGARPALVSLFQEKRLDYATLDREADRVAAALLASGIAPGDRVAIWSANRFEWLVAHHGAVRIGAIVVTVNPAFRAAEAAHVLKDSETCLLFLSEGFRSFSFLDAVREIRPGLPALRLVVSFDRAAEDCEAWDAFLEQGAAGENADIVAAERFVTFDDACSLQYTSGTTGRPKGALLTHHNILNNGHFVGERQRLSEHDSICLPVPFFHCYGLVLGAMAAVTHGSALVLPGETFEPEKVLAAIQSEGCTSFYGVPMMYIALLNHPSFERYDLRSLRTGCIGAAPCPLETLKQTVSRMNMREVTPVYGMTETSPISFQSMPDDEDELRVSTVGAIHPHLEAKIVDPATKRVAPRGQAGELCIRGYSVMRGYWRNPEATREAIDENRWMHSGDLAVMLPNGYVQIVGRIKDTIIRGGENIYPREVEEFLLTLPQVHEAYVFGLPDEKYGEIVCAWVKPREGAAMTPDELRKACGGRLATFKIPAIVRIVDQFPATASGKVQRFKMREAELADRAEGERRRA